MNRQSNKITAVYCRLAHYKGDTDRDIAKVQVEQLTRYAAEPAHEFGRFRGGAGAGKPGAVL